MPAMQCLELGNVIRGRLRRKEQLEAGENGMFDDPMLEDDDE